MNMHDWPLNKISLSKGSADFWISPAFIFTLSGRFWYLETGTAVNFLLNSNEGYTLMQMIIIIINVQLFIQSLKFKGEFADGKCSLTKFLPTYRKSGRVESVGTVVGQVGPTTYNVWQPSTKENIYNLGT